MDVSIISRHFSDNDSLSFSLKKMNKTKNSFC